MCAGVGPLSSSSSEAWHVGRTMRVLELLAFTPMSAPQVAAALHAQPRTVRRVLTRLVDDEYLTTREEGRRRLYEPTMRLVALAGQIVENSRLAQICRPQVDLLRERSQASAHLLVPSYTSALCIAHAHRADSDPSVHLRELVPAHCTAGGKALLAWRPRWRDSVLDAPLERFTPETVTDPVRLRRELDRIVEQGHATEDGEYQEGQRAVAMPIMAGEAAVAALCCSGPEIDPETLLPLMRRLVAGVAKDLARR